MSFSIEKQTQILRILLTQFVGHVFGLQKNKSIHRDHSRVILIQEQCLHVFPLFPQGIYLHVVSQYEKMTDGEIPENMAY